MKQLSQDIKVRTFNYAISVINICKEIQVHEKEFIITKQLMRSGTSIGANVREAKNAESRKDFIHKMSIAQKECDESIYWIELLIMTSQNQYEQLHILIDESNQLLRIIRTIILNTKKNLK